MSDPDIPVRLPDEAASPPEPPARRWARWGRDLVLSVGGALVLFLAIGALRAPTLPTAAPLFDLADLAGGRVALADLRGKTVVLNFWATWCGPCRIELPSLLDFAAAHPDVPVLFVAVDGAPEALRAFAAEQGMDPNRVLVADAPTRTAYGISTLPTTVVVSPEGTVEAAHGGLVFGPMLWWWTR